MRKKLVFCDRCTDRIPYDEDNDKLIDGAIFMIPRVLANGKVAENARQVELCKSCIWDLGTFMNSDI